MAKLGLAFAAPFLALILASCSSPSPQEQIDQRERDLMAPLKTKYPDVVMGYDFKGTTVDISIDPNAMLSLDEDAETSMKNAAVERWKSAWHATHNGQHGTVTVRLIDFRGTPYFKKSERV